MMATRILFRCDAGMQLGSGHVMRCLTLADALAERGAAVTFACSAESYETVPALGASGYAKITLDAPLDAEEIASAGACWDAAVVDHYRLDAAYEGALRRVALVILAIDDLADRPHDCDILLDQTLGREASDYAPLVPPAAELLLGPEYALLRPEFARARPAALAARAKGGPVRRILVSLGMTDIGGITARAVTAALAAGLEAEIAVAVGSRAESLPELRALAKTDPRVVLHVNCADIWVLIAESDLSIGACGTTSWERCCLGLPSIVLVLADNQRQNSQRLAGRGAVKALEDTAPAAIAATVGRLSADPAARVAMSLAAREIVDGIGIDRVAPRLGRHIAVRGAVCGRRRSVKSIRGAGPQLVARKAEVSDCEETWHQRNDHFTRLNARNTDPVSWNEHTDWFYRAIADPGRMICMVDAKHMPGEAGKGMAIVRFDPSADTEGCWRVSISLAPAFRGLGLGRNALHTACSFFFEQRGIATLEAEIRESNLVSARIFTALGFNGLANPATPGFHHFVRPSMALD